MPDAAGGGAPHGGQEQDDRPDQEPPPNPEALGMGQQEEQQPEDLPDKNHMQGDVSTKIIERMECKRLLERFGLCLNAAQATAHDHGYNTAKELSFL